MGKTLDLQPLRAEVVEDHYSLTVAFLFPSPRPALDFQICKDPSEQDVQLGMNTVYFGFTETGIGGYDIVDELKLVTGDAIEVALKANGQDLLGLPENLRLHFGRLENSCAIEKALQTVVAHHG